VGVREAAAVHDVPAELLSFTRAVEEVDLVAAPAHREMRLFDTPRGREVALHLGCQRFGDGVEHAVRWSVPLGVIDQCDGPHRAHGTRGC
jgi:hypothetical protein